MRLADARYELTRSDDLLLEVIAADYAGLSLDSVSVTVAEHLADMGYVVDVSQADSYMLPVAMSRMPVPVTKAARESVPLNCGIDPSVGTIGDGGRERVILEPGLL